MNTTAILDPDNLLGNLSALTFKRQCLDHTITTADGSTSTDYSEDFEGFNSEEPEACQDDEGL